MTTEATGTETVPQMRARIDELVKSDKAHQAENSKLAKENRRLLARDAFRGAGYLPEHGELFAAQAGDELDVSEKTIGEFAERFHLTKGASEEKPPAEEETGKGSSAESALAGMSRSGSRPGEGGQPPAGLDKTMTRDAWVELMKSDPVAGRKAVQEGRVQIRKDNPFAAHRRATNR